MLGYGTYAIVREAIHINTNEVYACKIINKELMQGREYMVRPRAIKKEVWSDRQCGAGAERNHGAEADLE